MGKARMRFALLGALVTGLIAGAVVPSQASAAVSNYSCTPKPSFQWCDGRANGSYDGLNSWDYNEGAYNGPWDNTVNMCQRVWKPSTGGILAGHGCALNFTWNDYGNVTCACYEAEILQISSGDRYILGYADSNY